MPEQTTNGNRVPQCFTAEGALEKVDQDYMFDPGEPGPLFLIPEDDVVAHAETETQVRDLGGKQRRIHRVVIRTGCTAIRAEYVRLDEVLRSARHVHAAFCAAELFLTF
jgi:hypothetical protein